MNISADDANLINAVAAQKLGTANAQGAMPTAAPQPPTDKPTAMDNVAAAASPKTEGTQQAADPFEFFEVDLGDGKKEVLTPNQIRAMVPRYKNMNYQHQTEVAPLKNSIGFLNNLRTQAAADGAEFSDEEFTGFLQSAISAYVHNPEMGASKNGQGPATNGQRQTERVQTNIGSVDPKNVEGMLAQWEQENAVTLPPMFRETLASSSKMASELDQMKQLLTQLAAGSKTAIEGAGEQLNQARTTNAATGMQKIQNNLQAIQNKYQFPDEAEGQFMTFMQERGYMIEDMMDLNLADKLAADFKAVLASPELERLKAIQQKRQAFTGTVAPSSTGGDAAPAPAASPDADFINTVASEHMKKRNMI